MVKKESRREISSKKIFLLVKIAKMLGFADFHRKNVLLRGDLCKMDWLIGIWT